MRRRQRVLQAIRRFFDTDGYLEVETPLLVTSPGLDPHLDAFAVTCGRHMRYLHTSPEYAMKRLVAEGFPAVYQICKAFRQDECGHLHNPEFTLLEWYRSGNDLAGLITDTEHLVAQVCHGVRSNLQLRRPDGTVVDLTPPWPRMTVRDAFRHFTDTSMEEALVDEERFFRALVDEIEPALDRSRPTVLYAYPASMASLARLSSDDPTVADRFEVYVDGVELCNGFAELTDPHEQRHRFQAEQQQRRDAGKPVYPIDEKFLSSLEHGLPACAGNALGVDRLVMLLSDAASIAEIMSFTSDQV